LVPFFVLACACAAPETKYKPIVTIQDAEQRQQQLSLPSAYAISPPSCQEVEMPLYPANAFAAKLPPVLVRVDFVVAEEGDTHSVRAGMLTASEFGADFEAAAFEAVSGWTCRPAFWINEEPGENWGPVFTEQAAYVIFQFDREAVDQRATFGQEQQP
jgi:hypothetical protein